MLGGITYLLGLVALFHVTVSVFAGIIRWFHMCHPYDQHPDYYYPARKLFVRFALSSVILVPFIVHPDDSDAWYLLRCYFFPALLFLLTNLMYAYFGSVMQWRKWKKLFLAGGTLVMTTLFITFVFAVWPGEQIGPEGIVSRRTAELVLMAEGILMTIAGAGTLKLVWRWLKAFDEDDYSNPNDFPVRFAIRMSMLLLVVMLLIWIGALIPLPGVMITIIVLITLGCILFLIFALHPQRTRPLAETLKGTAEETEEEPDNERQSYLQGLSKEKEAEILYAIQAVVVEQEAYLDPHLTLQDIATRCGYSRTYIAGLFKSELGGFFLYINHLRLEHAEAYQRLHPEATIQEVALESGFSSRQNYYSVKARLASVNQK